MTKTRLALAASIALSALASFSAQAASPTSRSGCAIVRDATGDTAADVGAPATLPQGDDALDLTAVDLAANDKWIGARVRLAKLDSAPPASGGESFSVSLQVSGGTLILGVGRYADPTGITGDDTYGYAGFQRGTLAPRDVPARAVQLSVDPLQRTASVFVDRAALLAIGANVAGSVTSLTASSGRQYGNELTVDYDSAAGSAFYRLGAPSCLKLPS